MNNYFRITVYHPAKDICAILDRNMYQNDGPTEDIMSLEPLAEKWRAFKDALRLGCS